MKQIIKIAFCDWWGNENLHVVNDNLVYCHNCGEYTSKDKLKYREGLDYERIVYCKN